MGKAQSKRSVDITTETKKGTEEEITEKMGKIEDLDKKEVVNGDATITEKTDHPEKMDVEVAENDKDQTTEKDVDVQASGDSAEPQNTTETSKEEGDSAAAEEEISPLADESIKKPKKEKVKKKWSFRSISFGKKDKLKPAKSEEVAEDDSAAGNGADEKTNESDDTKKDKSAIENEEKTTENHENGNATPQELMNEEQNGEKPSDNKTAHTTNNTTTTETCETVQKETAAVSSHLSEKTENTAVNNETKTSENATVADASKTGNGVDEKRNASDQEPQKPASAEASSEKISLLANAATNESSATTNGEVVDKIHQNGDHGESDQAVIEKSKAQIEVNSNTDNNVSAATLDSLSSTSISPSNVQTPHVHDLKASSEVPDEIVPISNDEPVIDNSTDTDLNAVQTVEPDVGTVEEPPENIAQITEVFGASSSSSKTLDNEISSPPEKLGVVDSSPPPLPISPPPSQVSVFAFINNEDTIQTKNFESANNNLIEEEKTVMPLPSSNLPLTEIDSSQEIGSIPVVVSETFDEKLISQEPDVQHQDQEDQFNNINVEIKKCQENKVEEDDAAEEEEEDADLCKDLKTDQVMSSSVISDESHKIDEEAAASVAFAATVIEEITETAAEIVNQHLKCDTEQITDQLFEKICNDGAKNNDNDDNIIVENYIEDKTQSDKKDPDDDQDLLMCEDDQKLVEQLPLAIKAIECSLDLTESNLMHQTEQEMNSVNMSNNLDDETHLDPTKEFATAKDIKDNVTVAEITQDLSVTCE